MIERFLKQCQTQPEAVALRVLDRGLVTDVSWIELSRLTAWTIERIQASSADLRLGDHLATYLPNGLAWILVDLAAQYMGWVHVALDTRLPPTMAAACCNTVALAY